MAKQKKNSNYATDKRRAAEEQKAEQKRKEKQQKTIKLAAIWGGSVIGVIAIIFAILFAVGVFDYSPEVTYHASFGFSDGSSVHIELYGHDAPKTVENFIDLCNSKYFEDMSVREFADGVLSLGSFNKGDSDKGIKGEFKANGVDNKVPMKKGYVYLNRNDDDYDSGYGQFCILTKNKTSLSGEYAAFGKVTDMSVIENMLKNLDVNDDGYIVDATAPRITTVSVHASDSHDH